MRIAILSADVAGGHDAAAKTLREQLLQLRPDAEITIDNGLEATGALLHHGIRDGFRIQLGSSSGSYDVMLGLLSKRPVVAAARAALGAVGSRGVRRLLDGRRPDLVVSLYPVVTSVVGRLRERGELDAPVVAPIPDASPHPMWLHPAVDLHLVPTPGDVERMRAACAGASVRHVRPLLGDEFLGAPPSREEARERTGLGGDEPWVVVDHSAWNVPPVQELVDPLLARTDARAVVMAAGWEEELVRDVRERYAHTSRVQVRDDGDDKPVLYAAADFVLTTVASTTAFAASAMGTPPLLFRELAGHGTASAESASHEGLVLWARTVEELGRIVSGEPPWPEVASAAVAAGRRLLEAQPAAEAILELG